MTEKMYNLFDLTNKYMQIAHIEFDKTCYTMYVTIADTIGKFNIAVIGVEFKHKYPSRWHTETSITWNIEPMNTPVKKELRIQICNIATAIMNDHSDEFGFVTGLSYG